jgi:hypothetical protein
MMMSFRSWFRFPFRILVLAAVAACGEVVDDGGGDDDVVDPPIDDACDDASECAGDEACVVNDQGNGECMTACRLYDDSTCDAGETCVIGAAFAQVDTMVTYCRTFGTAATWEACDEVTPCAPDHSCWTGTCVPHCDDGHACVDSLMTCVPPTNYPFTNPSNAGACQ